MMKTSSKDSIIHRTNKPVPGGTMAAVHFGPRSEPVKMVYLHANGFNGLTYRSLLEPLCIHEGVHIMALDLRGHGRTDLPIDDENLASPTNHARDLSKYLQSHIDGSIIVAGHSLGANTAIIAAGIVPDKITKVLAFDPIVLPISARIIMASRAGRNFLMKNYPFAKNAGRRRDQFSSPATAYKRYHGRGPFKHFPTDVLHDYIQDGFIEHEGGVRLACRPKWEQLGYVNQAQNMKRRITNLPKGSRIIITDFVKQSEGWMRRTRRRNPDLQIDYHPTKDHFFPVVEPDMSREALRDILSAGF
ncbi:MAG: alpha/beta hydrolase [Robiginitomaculum sp.]|nr:alpha/beta hydrolase [Robiginitomaculum sp.]